MFSSQAVRFIQRLPRNTAVLIRKKIDLLAADSFNPILDAKKLHGRFGFRLRVGDWRILYELKNEELIIIVITNSSRGNDYK